MTLPGILNTAHTLSYYSTLQDITANNLANASSDAYKGDRITAQSLTGQSHPVPVQSIDLRQGDIRDTQRPLDLALQGSGFFVVQTPAGERLTRGGSLQVSPATGALVDRNGNPVLGTHGPIVAAGGKVEVAADGSVLVNGASAGQLRIETVANLKSLTKQGAGLFVAGSPTVAATDVAVHQGAIEDSNVSSVMGSIDLITIQRAYAASVEALHTMDGVLSTVTSDIGRVTP